MWEPRWTECKTGRPTPRTAGLRLRRCFLLLALWGACEMQAEGGCGERRGRRDEGQAWRKACWITTTEEMTGSGARTGDAESGGGE